MEKTENAQVIELFRNTGVNEIVNFVKEDGSSVRLVVTEVSYKHLCMGCYMEGVYGGACPFIGSCASYERPDRKKVIFKLCDSCIRDAIFEMCTSDEVCDAHDKECDVYDEEGDVNVGGDIEKLTVADLKMAKCFLEEDLTDLICKFEEKTGVSVKGLGFNKDMSVIIDLDI